MDRPLDREDRAYVATYVGVRRHGTLATISRRRVTNHYIKPVTHAYEEAAEAVEGAHVAPSKRRHNQCVLGVKKLGVRV